MKRSQLRKSKVRDKISLFFLIIFSCVIFVGTVTFAYVASSIKETVNDTAVEYETSKRKEIVQVEEEIPEGRPIGILLMGTDDGQGRQAEEGARSDTLIYVTVNPKTQSTHLYSISRDLFTKVDEGSYQKINAAYSLGQEAKTVEAVEYLLNAPVDEFISVNMNALVDLVNAIGGIEVNNQLGIPISISAWEPAYTSVVDPGIQHINGEQALVYARMRYDDPEGDVGRQKRQQEVISSIVTKLRAGSIVTQYPQLLDVVRANVKTSINFDDSTRLLRQYEAALHQLHSSNVTGRGEEIGGIYYMVAGQHNLLEIQNSIRRELELPELTELNLMYDPSMLLVDDLVLPLDAGTHYDFAQ